MVQIEGKGVFGGIAIGRIAFFHRHENTIKRYHIDDPDSEITRFHSAKGRAKEDLQRLYEKAFHEVGETNAAIFEIHQMMLDDLDYCESIENIIRTQEINAEYAVGTTGDNFAQMFASMDDAYMKERAADVKDVSERLLGVLSNHSGSGFTLDEPVIIAADDLAPSETVQLDKNKVLGFVTKKGSTNSHTAILARTMNIPAVIHTGSALTEEADGQMAIIDGFTGTVYLNPDAQTLAQMKEKQDQELERKALLKQLRGKKNTTKDGQEILIYANIGSMADVGAVLQNDAGGIGLFRSEFLYLENQDYPSEEQQFHVYKTVAENMAGKKIIIRTLDIGADKQADYFKLPKEENPALGYRAIRICLTRQDIFKTQLRALYRASAYGTIAIMFPMIISISEVQTIKEIISQVQQELDRDGIPYNKALELGIMIETPAAALLSQELASEVDFFSIGTNDLTQYTLALDRQNPSLDVFYDPHHPAVLRMIQMVVENAHRAGIWVGICGELGADLDLTEFFLSLGVDELSVSPSSVLPLRQKVRETNVKECKDSALILLNG